MGDFIEFILEFLILFGGGGYLFIRRFKKSVKRKILAYEKGFKTTAKIRYIAYRNDGLDSKRTLKQLKEDGVKPSAITIGYKFEIGGKTYKGKGKLDPKGLDYCDIKTGGEVTIRYLKTNPKINVYEDDYIIIGYNEQMKNGK